jgi:hypothetical protein
MSLKIDSDDQIFRKTVYLYVSSLHHTMQTINDYAKYMFTDGKLYSYEQGFLNL